MKGNTVAIVMRSRLCLDHLRFRLPECPGFEVIAYFSTLDAHTLSQLTRLQPNAVLLDVGDSHQLGDISAVRHVAQNSRIIAAEVRLDKRLIAEIAAVGVEGFTRHGGTADEIAKAIIGSLNNPPLITDSYIAYELNAYVNELFNPTEPQNAPWEVLGETPPSSPLTRRETEVLSMIASGASNKEIARQLSLELSTIKNHVHSILNKYQVRRRSQAAARYTQSRRRYVNET